MIIFLYGLDTFRSRQKLNEIIEHYQKTYKNWLNLKYFEGKTIDFEDFKNEVQTVSMFAEKKLIILKEVFSNQNFKENFLKNSKKFTDSKEIIVFYEKNQISEKDPLFNFLIKQAKFQEFRPLEGQKLKNWVKKEIENYQASITSQALEKLINYLGNDLWQLSNEIKKLVSFTGLKQIEVNDVENLIRPKIGIDIFKTIDAIASKNKREALNLIHKHLERGDSPLYLLSMINFQFRNLLMVRSQFTANLRMFQIIDNLSRKLELHPYVIKKTFWQARKFTFEELKRIYQKIFQADLNIKTGKLDSQIALDLLILEI